MPFESTFPIFLQEPPEKFSSDSQSPEEKYFKSLLHRTHSLDCTGEDWKNLSILYDLGRGTPKDLSAAFKCAKQALRLLPNDKEILTYIAWSYFHGKGTIKDIDYALHYATIASNIDGGTSMAFYIMSLVYSSGTSNVPSNYTLSFNYNHRAANLSDATSEILTSLAVHYYIRKDYEYRDFFTFKYLKLGSEKEGVTGENLIRLGSCYALGKGTKQDPRQALKCFQLATEKKSVASIAWYFVGVCYSLGVGIKKADYMALACFQLSVHYDKNNAFAWKKLAKHYNDGLGTGINFITASECEENAKFIAENKPVIPVKFPTRNIFISKNQPQQSQPVLLDSTHHSRNSEYSPSMSSSNIFSSSHVSTPKNETIPLSDSSFEQIAPPHLGTPIIADDIPWFISSTTLSLDEPTRSLFTNNAAIQNQPLQEKTMHSNFSTSQNITYRQMPIQEFEQNKFIDFGLPNCSTDTVCSFSRAPSQVEGSTKFAPLSQSLFLTQFDQHTTARRSVRLNHKKAKGEAQELQQTFQNFTQGNIDLKKQRLEAENMPMHASHTGNAIHYPSSKKRF